jgi:hypothetical protein
VFGIARPRDDSDIGQPLPNAFDDVLGKYGLVHRQN